MSSLIFGPLLSRLEFSRFDGYGGLVCRLSFVSIILTGFLFICLGTDLAAGLTPCELGGSLSGIIGGF